MESPRRGRQICGPMEDAMSDAFSNLSIHLVFSTKDRIPLMTKHVRKKLFPYIGGIVKGLGGTVIAVGGMPDHVHVLARVPPKSSVSDVVRTIKANSSKKVQMHFAVRETER